MPSGAQQQFFQAHLEDIALLAVRFSGYSTTVDELSIRRWLAQFDDSDLELGMKLLQHVEFYNQPTVLREQKILHDQLLQINTAQREIVCCPFGRAGKSSGELLHKYKMANRGRILERQFIYQSQLSEAPYMDRTDLMVALVDDFVGTGNQVVEDWASIDGFINQENEVYLCVLCGTEEGISHVERETRLRVVSNKVLREENKLFSDSNLAFTQDERHILREYCERAGSQPEGYGNCQSTIIFYFRAPDNAISILRCKNSSWKGLFVRNP